MRRLWCALLGHRRSEYIRRNLERERWESVCKTCGEQIIRIKHDDWRTAQELEKLQAQPQAQANGPRV